MKRSDHQTAMNTFIAPLTIAVLLSFSATTAAAFDNTGSKTGSNREVRSSEMTRLSDRVERNSETVSPETSTPEPSARDASAPAASAPAASAPEAASISYVLYSDALKAQPEPAGASSEVKNALGEIRASKAFPTSGSPPVPPAVSTAPMSAGEKFNLFFNKSFRPPGPYALSIFSGLFNELLDKNDGRDSSVGDYFADSMTRAARSFAFRATSNFFEKFAYATVFKQDPRYHRSDKRSAGGKIGYAISRLFITQGDRSGDQVNISYLAGGLTAAGIANVWEREERQTVGHTFRRWGTHLWLTAASNILREFLGGQ